MVRYLFYTIGDLTYQSPLVHALNKNLILQVSRLAFHYNKSESCIHSTHINFPVLWHYTHVCARTHWHMRTRTVSNVWISSVMWCHEIWCIVSSVVEELGCLHLLWCIWWFWVLMQRWYLYIELCCVTSWKNTIFMFTYLTSPNPRGVIFAKKVVICFVFQCVTRMAMSSNQHGIAVAYQSFGYFHRTSCGLISINTSCPHHWLQSK